MKSLAKEAYNMMKSEAGETPLAEWQIDEIINLAKLEGSCMTNKEDEAFLNAITES